MIYKIVLTGGPCSGKTASVQRIISEFSEKGYKVVVVPDAASLLINSGIKPFGDNVISEYDFQKCVIDLQLNLERIALSCLDTAKETIVLCDGGIIDNKAFTDEDDFVSLMDYFNLEQLDVSVSYDLVIHLRSWAVGKEEFYTLYNNCAGSEKIDEAKNLDQKILESWAGHSKLRIIDNDGSFEDKMNDVCNKIYDLIRKPRPIQVQRKYLVDYINLDEIDGIDFNVFDIEQYIVSEGGRKKYYRKTISGDDINYSLINNVDINDEKIVTEKRIDEREFYDNYPGFATKKRRYTFEYNKQYFKLDVFEDKCILEVDLTKDSKDFDIPNFIYVRKDVTEDTKYIDDFTYPNKVLKLV